ncbi:hypothetical protein Q73_10195 [Bacillus coahuilensis m2-6]|uniref:hypothetical protein n=1 Tax=Bacillus coahuilensis TaxID=408580 RepID=UPI0001851168|nr:hypothetical protein [Bacillus coahuilensis]KUP06958.1 hypothetical protein Q73_10195 [Bacillus coahuilensis m2-6]
MKELIVNAKGRDKRWALREDGMLQEFHTRQGTHQSKVGSVYYAVVEKVVSGLQAAFVNFGEDKRAFLSKEDVASFASCKDEKNT